MKRILLSLKLLVLITGITSGQEKLIADTSKTTLSWLGEKVTGQHTGSIKLQAGWLMTKDNKIV
jgi:hypothetical protein